MTYREYWHLCMCLRYGDWIPNPDPEGSTEYGKVQVAKENPNDVGAAPDMYAPNPPDHGPGEYRDRLDPFRGSSVVADVESGIGKEQLPAEIIRTLKVEKDRNRAAAKQKRYRQKLRDATQEHPNISDMLDSNRDEGAKFA